MKIVAIFPLVFSVFAAMMFAIGDYGRITKGVSVLLAATALSMQFFPILHERVHFLIPLLLQLVVCAWYYLANQFE